MEKKNISIKDIAGDLNVSITTVSFVLNGKAKEKHISKKVTERILDYVEKVNYKPNQAAQSLRTGKSKMLVFMVEDISNLFFANLARIIEDIANDSGYNIIYCSNENKDEKSSKLIGLLKNRNVDGFIIVPSPGIKNLIGELINENFPVILLDRYFLDFECNSVVIDYHQATFSATSHLVANNFKNIAFITTDSDQMQILCSLSGYENAIADSGLISHTLKIPHQGPHHKLKDSIKDFINNTKNTDAIFFATSDLARAGLELFKEMNIDLWNNLEIVIFDDNYFFEIYDPTITSIIMPLKAIGDNLMELMLKILNGQKNITEKIVLNTDLKIRKSSIGYTKKM